MKEFNELVEKQKTQEAGEHPDAGDKL